jgi:hypothetical protein
MTTIAEPSIMSLLIKMRCNGRPLAKGTGFVVRKEDQPFLITNRHNVTGRHQETGQPLSPTGALPDDLKIVHNRENQLGKWVIKTESLFDRGQPRWIEHPTLGERADFVAVPLTQLEEVDLYPYDLINPGANLMLQPADIVSVIGFPFGIQAGGSLAVWATGFIASEPGINFNDLPIFLIDCRTRRGQSGSAVIAYRSAGAVADADGGTSIYSGPVWRFLGIYSGRINEESDLGIVWKASSIRELIDPI